MALPSPEFGSVLCSANCAGLPANHAGALSPARCAADETASVAPASGLAHAALGIVAIHLAQRLQHIAAFVGKVLRHFHELRFFRGQGSLPAESPLPKAISRRLRDSASHIWYRGLLFVDACSFNTSAISLRRRAGVRCSRARSSSPGRLTQSRWVEHARAFVRAALARSQ